MACGAAGSGAEAALRLVDRNPLVVKGTGFASHENVRVTLVGGERTNTRARADDHGTFVVTFPMASSRCDLARVIAVRSGGGRVVLKLLPLPACIAQ
jgi:hypothetical protein